MASIERTAYPRFRRLVSVRELASFNLSRQLGPSVPGRHDRGHPLRLDVPIPGAVPHDAVVARLAVASAARGDRTMLLVPRKHTLVASLRVFSGHAAHHLRHSARAPGLLAHPPLEFGDRVEA